MGNNQKATILIFLMLQILNNCGYSQAPRPGYNASSDVQGNAGKTWAVIVGISRYQNIPGLLYADKDAEAFYDYLVNVEGGPKVSPARVKLILNENARSTEIYGALDWLRDSVMENDRVIFYFSGHADVENKTTDQGGFLLAYDSPLAAYVTTGTVSIKYLNTYLNAYLGSNKAKDIILIADACRSGKLAGGNGGVALTRQALKQGQNDRIIKILSAQDNELSLEGTKWGGGRGVFSFYLIKGIEGFADRNNNRFITTAQLASYLEPAVADATENTQHPEIDGNSGQELFPFNQKLFALAKQDENTSPKINGSIGTGVAVVLSPDIELFYEKYLNYVKDGRLIWGNSRADTVNCAKHVYLKLINAAGAESIKGSLKSSFFAALQQKMQAILDNYIYRKKTSFEYDANESYLELSYLKTLTGPDYVMRNYMLARSYFIEGITYRNYQNKIKWLESLQKALRFEDDSPYILAELAAYYHASGKPDSASYYYQKAESVAPEWPFPYNGAGILYEDAKNFGNAIIWYNKAIQVDSTFANAYYNLGRTYQELHQFDKALLNYQKAIKIRPDISQAYHNIGIIYDLLNDYDKAIANYQKDISVDTAHSDSYGSIGVVYQKLQAYDKAIVNYQKAIQIDSTNSMVYNNLGSVYLTLEAYDRALLYLNKAILLDSTNAKAYFNLGSVYLGLKSYKKAIENCRRAIALKSSEPDFYTNLGLAYVYDKSYKKGILCLKKALTFDVNDPAKYYNLACAYSRWKNTKKSLGYIRQTIEKGYKDYNQFMQDDDLSNLRKTVQFTELMKQHFPDKVK